MVGEDIIILAIGSAISMLVGGIGKTLIDGRKQNSEATLSANDQALLIYKGLLITLQKSIAELTAELTALELEFLSARENLVEVRVTNKFLMEKNKELMELVNKFKKDMSVISATTE